jgi:hypothetical protein
MNGLEWLGACLTPGASHQPPAAPPLQAGTVAAPNFPDKAKMDYQLELDKKKAEDQYRYTRRGILWDKGVFALLGVALGAFILYLVNTSADARRATETHALESFKLAEAKQRFFTEKRLAALVAVSAAMSEVNREFFDHSGGRSKVAAAEATAAYHKALEAARQAVNRNMVLLGVDFDEQASWYIQVHRSIRDTGVKGAKKYRNFISYLDNQFNDYCRAVLEQRPEGQRQGLTLEPIPFAEREQLSPQAYLDRQFAYWQKAKREAH